MASAHPVRCSTPGSERLAVCSRALQARRRSHSHATTCVGRGTSDDVYLLDYGAGNVRSVRNAVKRLGYNLREVEHALPTVS